MRLVGPRGLARRVRFAGWGECPARGAAAAHLVEDSRLRRFVLALALSALAAPAFASGIGLRWGSCEGASNRNFACDENNGTDVLVASFSPPGGVGALSGVAAWGHISAAQGSVPPWWQLSSADGCRGSSLAASFLFFGETECDDPWNGQGMGGIAYVRADGQGMGFLVAVAVSASLVQPVAAGRTYSAFKLIINHDQSTGAGSCAGCQTPVCITLDRMILGQPNESGYRDVELTQGMSGLSGGAANVVTWQGGTPSCGAGGPKASTWGKLKERYR